MALVGIQEYIARDVNNIARVEDEGNIVSIEGNIFLSPSKKSHPIIIIHIGLCVSSYYFTIVRDCRLPFCLFTNRPKKRVRSSYMRKMISVGQPNSYDKS